jgi:hypothetical protein
VLKEGLKIVPTTPEQRDLFVDIRVRERASLCST